MESINILEQRAIDAAINTHWKEALALNLKITRQDKKNIDAYLRLGFAYLQLKKINEAKKCYQKVLQLQPNNQTALENLERIKILAGKKIGKKSLTLNPNLFLEIPGRTKSVTLVNPGQKNLLAQLTVGQKVILRLKKRRIEIRTMEKEYVGCLPDDLSRRLSILIKAGSQFSAYIKQASLKSVVVFLKEEKRGKRVWKYLPFPINAQSHLSQLSEESSLGEQIEEENEELTDADLERLAENLVSQEKEDYLPFNPEEKEELEEE